VLQQLNSGLHRLNVEASVSHIVWYKHPERYLCTRDQPFAEAATYTTKETNIHSLGGNPTYDPNNEEVIDLSLRKHG
jgi:hypothetical protein